MSDLRYPIGPLEIAGEMGEEQRRALIRQMADARSGPVELSLVLLEALHQRWASLLESLSPADWSRTMFHPERGELTLAATLSMHAWHGRHHVAQITALRKRAGWG
jgi:hypothetical protein